jgi:hypothetical protein
VPNTETLHREQSEPLPSSPQPNILAVAPDAALMTAKVWTMVLLTGVGAALGSLLLLMMVRSLALVTDRRVSP